MNKGEELPANVGQPHGSASAWPWAVPMMQLTKPTKAVLRDHFDPQFPGFNPEYPDQLRADEFLNEFDGFVRARNEGNGTQLPAFVLLYLPDDHTRGTTPGMPRPAASVADNDLAVGRVVEAVSHSPYWNDTAILILEDDAQDGTDHVDAHRSIAFVISKYSPGSSEKPYVEHGFYTTVNMIHTLETLLGLPPMNQNDAYAPVMGTAFFGPGQPASLHCRPEQSRKWIYLPDQSGEGTRSCGIGQDGFLPSGPGESSSAECHPLARSQRGCATTSGEAHDSGGQGGTGRRLVSRRRLCNCHPEQSEGPMHSAIGTSRPNGPSG